MHALLEFLTSVSLLKRSIVASVQSNRHCFPMHCFGLLEVQQAADAKLQHKVKSSIRNCLGLHARHSQLTIAAARKPTRIVGRFIKSDESVNIASLTDLIAGKQLEICDLLQPIYGSLIR